MPLSTKLSAAAPALCDRRDALPPARASTCGGYRHGASSGGIPGAASRSRRRFARPSHREASVLVQSAASLVRLSLGMLLPDKLACRLPFGPGLPLGPARMGLHERCERGQSSSRGGGRREGGRGRGTGGLLSIGSGGRVPGGRGWGEGACWWGEDADYSRFCLPARFCRHFPHGWQYVVSSPLVRGRGNVIRTSIPEEYDLMLLCYGFWCILRL